MDTVRAAAQAQAHDLKAEVARWRDEAGLAEQKARQELEKSGFLGGQAEMKLGELRDELQLRRDMCREPAVEPRLELPLISAQLA